MVGTGTVGVGGTFDITTSTAFADGSVSFTAKETNGVKTSASSQTFYVNVDPSAPTGLTQMGTPSNGGSIEITGQTTDAAGDTITLYHGNTVIGSGLVKANGSFDVTAIGPFADGTYSNITATDTSADGSLTSGKSAAVTANVYPSAPVITTLVVTPVNGSTVELQGTGEVGDTVNIFADGGTTLVGTGTVGAGGTFDITTRATFFDGVQSFTATETDAANLTSTASSPAFSVNVDPTAPTGLSQVGTPTNGGPIEITGHTTDAAGDIITLYNGNTVIGSGLVKANGSFDVTANGPFPDGTYSVSATDTSADGSLTSGKSAAVTANVDPSAPVITTLVATPVNGGTVEVQGIGEAGETVDIYADGGKTIAGTGTVGPRGIFNITTTLGFADGVHSFTATETDVANLTSTASTPAFSVSVLPSAPIITNVVGQPIDNSSVEVVGFGEVGDAIKLYADGNSTTVVGTGTVGANGTFDITTTATFNGGQHSFTATATDPAKLTSSLSNSSFSFDLVVLPPPRTGNPVVVPPAPAVVIAFGELSLPVTTTGQVTIDVGFVERLTPRAEVFVMANELTVNVADDGTIDFDVPLNQHHLALNGDVVSVTATLADGRPLPAWLKFNGRTGQFAGLVPETTGSIGPDSVNPDQPRNPNRPAQLQNTIEIEVVSHDSKGNLAISRFTIDPSARRPHDNDRHGWNQPSNRRLSDIALVTDFALSPLRAGDHRSWQGLSVWPADRLGAGGSVDDAPAGRAGFSDQIKGHGWHAATSARMALLESLRQGAASWRQAR
jgi:hypothetical protein